MKKIVISSQKGGVGKTTTAFMLADGLAREQYRVLALDSDPQCNLTGLCDFEEKSGRANVFGLMRGDIGAEDAICRTQFGFDLIPCVPDVSELAGSVSREYRLQRALQEVSGLYDAVVIDTPPSLGLLTKAALIAGDLVVIPMSPDGFSRSGAEQLCETIRQVKNNRNQKIRISGFLLTRTDRTKLTGLVREQVRQMAQDAGTKLYEAEIRQSVAVRESQFYRKSLFSGSGAAVKDARTFISEFVQDEFLPQE